MKDKESSSIEMKDVKKEVPIQVSSDQKVVKPKIPSRKEKIAIRLQRNFRERAALKIMSEGTFWQSDDKPPEGNFIKKQSLTNIKSLQSELGKLQMFEARFLKLFMSLDFQLTHFTREGKSITDSGCIFSTLELEKYKKKLAEQGKKLPESKSSADEEDKQKFANHDYVFFRFEIEHKDSNSSRFGGDKIILDGRASGLLETGWVSPFDMLAPHNISIVNKLRHDNKIMRMFKGYDSLEKDKLLFYYPQIRNSMKLNILHTIFYGQDILQGIGLTVIKELRLIGGSMQEEFMNDILKFPVNIDCNSQEYKKWVEKISWLLSRLFRFEAKIPRTVYLKDKPCKLQEKEKLKMAIAQDNLELCKELLSKNDIDKMCFFYQNEGMNTQYTPLTWAAKNGSMKIVDWLIQMGADPKIPNSSGEGYLTLLSQSAACLSSSSSSPKLG